MTDGSLYSRPCYSALFACSVSRLWDSHQTVGPYGLPPIDPSPHPLLLLKVSTSVSTNVITVTFLGKRTCLTTSPLHPCPVTRKHRQYSEGSVAVLGDSDTALTLPAAFLTPEKRLLYLD